MQVELRPGCETSDMKFFQTLLKIIAIQKVNHSITPNFENKTNFERSLKRDNSKNFVKFLVEALKF